MKNSFKIGEFKGIRIEINFSWLIIFVIIVWSMAANFFPANFPELNLITRLLLGTLSAVLLFLSVLLHELAHAAISLIQKIPVKRITLVIFGGLAEMEKEPDEPVKEFKIAISGPAMSLLLYIVFILLSNILNRFGVQEAVVASFSYIASVNLILGLFNLIPAFPLDGGRVLRALIWHFSKDLHRATKVSSSIGRMFGYLLIFLGVLILLNGNFINGLWLLFIGWLINQMSQSSYQSMVVSNLFDKIQVSDFMNADVVSVEPFISVRKLVDDYFLKYKYTFFPVINGEIILGIVNAGSVKSVPKDELSHTSVSTILVPLSDTLIVSPKETVSAAMKKTLSNGVGRVLVIEDNRLLGLISKTDILKYLAIYEQLS